MNFFEHQANARRQTGRLLVYFLLSVLFTVLATNVALFFFGQFFTRGLTGGWLWHEWSRQALTGVLMIIVGGSAIEYLRLRGGGQALAEMLGARRIDFATTEAGERQYLNVVAEMAIASGVPSPLVYVMDREQGINAFVAGLSMDKTVMVVTAGALETFDRDELQAVVGHEFSHILNGDMRLNVRLLALLAGILAIGQLGSFLMRIAVGSRSRRKGGIVHLFVVGLLLWLVGAIGLFFGRLIKAAISRQREFLADASSVQFTRNPDGLAGALLKIRNHSADSWLDNLRAESMSHMCFAETLGFSSWFATHPPLEDRISALGRHYLVRDRARQRELQRRSQTAAETAAIQGLAPQERRGEYPPISYVPDMQAAEGSEPVSLVAGPAALILRAGTLNPRELASARALHRRLPPGVRQALESCEGSQALLYALLARQSAAPRPLIRQYLQEHEPALQERIHTLWRLLEGLDAGFALPLTELAQPRLQLLDAAAQGGLLSRLQGFTLLDRRLSIFEFALLMLLRKQLQRRVGGRQLTLTRCLPAVAVVVAALLRTGGLEGEKLERSYQRLMRTVSPVSPALPPPDLTRLSQLAGSLQRLAGLSPPDKKQLLELAATAVLADAEIRLEEYELLRVAAAMLDCPMPLLDL